MESSLRTRINEYCGNRLQEYLPSDKFPVALYHYTSSEAMLSILKSGKLRVNHIEHLSDKTELRYAVTIFRARLDRSFASEDDNNVRRLFQCMKKRLEVFEARDAFIASFTTNGDEASMWSLYGDRGTGFSFAIPTFMVERWGGFPCKCQYDEAIVDDFCSGALRTARDALIADLAADVPVDYARYAEEFLYNISYFAPMFKQRILADENEFRLFFLAPSSEHKRKENGNAYIAVPRDERLPIAAICAGPSCDYETQVRPLQVCLLDLGLKIPVHRSKFSNINAVQAIQPQA